MPPPFRLDLLGDPAFSGPAGPVRGRAAHKRRVALLAVLAVARGRPVGRERIIGLLWPELTTEAARHNLSESLYVLRKELGEGVSAASAGDVVLSPEAVASDVAEFQDRLEAGDAEGAAALYRGPLLDGFFVGDAPEFERWIDGERDRLARAYATALEGLAQAAETEGSAIRAVDWWRRLAAHDPFSSRTALRLVRALDAAGERPSAMRAAEMHAALLRQELGGEPDPDLLALVARLRADPPRAAAPVPPLAHRPAAEPSPPPPAIHPPEPTVFSSVAVLRPGSPASPADEVDRADPVNQADAVDRADPVGRMDVAGQADAVGRVDAVDQADAAGWVDASGAASIRPVPFPADAADAAPIAPPSAPYAPVDAEGPRRTPAVRAPLVARRRTSASYAAAGGMLLGFLLSLLTGSSLQTGRNVDAARNDPRRIAVLYFEDLSPGGELQYLAAGLTERLIHELGQVDALDVVSRGGVRPYRGGAVRFDSMAAHLRVGSVVEGTVQRSRDSVWVTVALVDANTQRHLHSREIGRPLGDVVALERAVAAEVSAALRKRLGQEVRLRTAAAETESAEARERVLMAEQLRREGRAMAISLDTLDTGSAARLLLRADSLLARGQAADPRWAQPTLLRGWVDVDRAGVARGEARNARLRSAQRHAEQVLAQGRGSRAEALELRGTALYRLALEAPDTLMQRVWMDTAETDLRAATAAEPSRASVWSTLSQLLRIRGRLAESEMAARRALAADAYLDDMAAIRHLLYFSGLWRGDYAQAHEQCEQGAVQFPADRRFTECRLTLLRNDRTRPADAAAAWRLVAELDRMDPPARARAQNRVYGPIYRRMVAAAVSARAGDADSARAVVARARREVGAHPALAHSLNYEEAWVRLMLRDTAGARMLVDRMLAYRPSMREYLLRDPLVVALAYRP
ncbi:MAG TPA: BTAD domain-containing putative transcriptional regulator [Longimicrobium sp.]|jgi:DNA-binding SARP family transcriptional activator/TolB-like protein|uniref:BTAD domain-containing putative transcriptional regulator n=1 Tax=Longimicrobium sp. TaxID=2029185 RepID=UPI002ED91EE2